MQRITIAGNSGSGKSTLSEELGVITRLPVYHLDLIQFKPGWKKTPEPEFDQKHENWLMQEQWLIEGVGPWKALKKRFAVADTIMYLDFTVEYCLQKAAERLEKDKKEPNPFVPPNSPYAAKADKQEEVIRFFHKEWRPKILALQEFLKTGRNTFVFTSPEAMEAFKLELKAGLV